MCSLTEARRQVPRQKPRRAVSCDIRPYGTVRHVTSPSLPSSAGLLRYGRLYYLPEFSSCSLVFSKCTVKDSRAPSTLS